ncbi:hypothetical protein PFISCL1PPCAC_17698, partial [Pristionchus fissidentatus]
LVCLPLLIWSLIYQADRLADQSNLQIHLDGTEGQSIRTRRTAGTGEKTEVDYSDQLNEEVKAKLDEAEADLGKKKEEFTNAEKELAMKQQDAIQKKKDYEEKKSEWERLDEIAIKKESDAGGAKIAQLEFDVVTARRLFTVAEQQVSRLLRALALSYPKYNDITIDELDIPTETAAIEAEVGGFETKRTEVDGTLTDLTNDEQAKKNLMNTKEEWIKRYGASVPEEQQRTFATLKREHADAESLLNRTNTRSFELSNLIDAGNAAIDTLKKLAKTKPSYEQASGALAQKEAAKEEAERAAIGPAKHAVEARNKATDALFELTTANTTVTAAESAVETASKKLNEARITDSNNREG